MKRFYGFSGGLFCGDANYWAGYTCHIYGEKDFVARMQVMDPAGFNV